MQENEDRTYSLAVLSSNLDNKLILSILPEIDQIHKLEFDFTKNWQGYNTRCSDLTTCS